MQILEGRKRKFLCYQYGAALKGWKGCHNFLPRPGRCGAACADVPVVAPSSLGTCYLCLLVFGTTAAVGLLREMTFRAVKTYPVIKPPDYQSAFFPC